MKCKLLLLLVFIILTMSATYPQPQVPSPQAIESVVTPRFYGQDMAPDGFEEFLNAPQNFSPFLPPTHSLLQTSFDPLQLEWIKSWFPLTVPGWPDWTLLDQPQFPLRAYLGSGLRQIIRLFVKGVEPPLSENEISIISEKTETLFYKEALLRTTDIEQFRYNLPAQQVWLYGLRGPVWIGTPESDKRGYLFLQVQDIDLNQKIVEAINKTLGKERITRIYIEYWQLSGFINVELTK